METIDLSLADSTKSNYARALQKIKDKLGEIPIIVSYIDLLKVLDALEFSTWSQVQTTRQALIWWHQRNGITEPPFHNKTVDRYLSGLEKKLCSIGKAPKQSNASEAIHSSIIFDTAIRWIQSRNLVQLRNALILLLQYVSLQRINAILSLKFNDLTDLGIGKGFRVHFREIKWDRLGVGKIVLIPPFIDSCNISIDGLIRLFLNSGKPQNAPNDFIFKPWDPKKQTWSSGEKHLSTCSWNCIIRQEFILTSASLSGVKVTSHSIRKTATSTLVENGASYEEVRPLLGHKAASAIFLYHKQTPNFQAALLKEKL